MDLKLRGMEHNFSQIKLFKFLEKIKSNFLHIRSGRLYM